MKGDIIVVGAGIGGLSCAALLAHGGYKVTVLEKNSFIGGACSSYQKQGYTFDRAVHMFSSGLNGPFGKIFNRLGLDYLKFVRHLNERSAMKIYRQDGYVPINFNINSITKVSKPTNANKEGLSSFFTKKTIKDFTSVMTKIITMNKRKLKVLYDEDLTVSQWLDQITEDPFIHGIFAFLLAGMFAIGITKASAAEFIHCFKAEMLSKEGYQYPVSGAAQAIPNAIARGIEHYGGKILTNSPVKSIVIKGNKVQGVLAGDKLIEAPIVVSNLSLKWTILNLVGRDFFEKKYLEKIESLTPSLSSMTFKLALKEPIIEKWALINCYHPTLHDWGDKYGPGAPLSNGFFGPVLSNIDTKVAPPGHQTVIFGTITPAKGPNWEKWKDVYWEDIKSFFPDLEKKLDFVDVSFPKDNAGASGKPSGPVEGLGLIPSQTGKNKPSSVLPIEGLYAVGDTCGRNSHGIGVQLAADSGINCADAIIGNIDKSEI